jgi:hypothetical protein
MRQYAEIILRGALVLLAATVVAVVVPAQGAISPMSRGGEGVLERRGGAAVDRDWAQRGPVAVRPDLGGSMLAQKATTKEETVTPPAPAPAPAPRKMRKVGAPPAEQMEKDGSKSMGIGDEPERVGTKKLGGQPIRAKED